MSNTKLLYKRESDLLRALSNFWDRLIARRALFLADEPTTVLDSPCGDGRFWPLLAEKRDRKIIATDKSATMLVSAWNANPSRVVERVRLHAPSFAMGLADASVDCIFSMRPFQGLVDASARLDLLREFHRITRDCLIISVDVKGDPSSGANGDPGHERIESEFRLAGFTLQHYIVRLPPFDLCRTYILRKYQTVSF